MKRMLMVATISRFLRDFLLPYAEHFRAQGWQVDALANGTSIYPECQKAFDRLWEIQWSRNPLDPRNLLGAPGIIKQLVEQEQYDIIHVHTPVAAFVTRYALRQMRLSGRPKVIYTAHGFHFHEYGNPVKNALFLALEKTAGRWTDYLVVINADDKDAAYRHRIVSPERLIYMPGIGLDMHYYHPDRISATEINRVRHELRMAPSDSLFLMVAEFNPGKHHQLALEAFARVHMPGIHLAFAGEGPMLETVRQLASDLGMLNRVHFLGFRSDIPTLIRTATATLLPSEREGLPRAIMESLSLEVPAIGTDIRGIRDLLADGRGKLVKVGDVKGLSQAIEWCITHAAEARSMGERGRKHMRNYDLKRVVSMHEDLYDQALSETVALREAA